MLPAIESEQRTMTQTASEVAFVPDGFDPPRALDHAQFRLRPLDVQHNERDYAAWTSSMQHIKATPGFADATWPHPMSLAANHDDLAKHAADFAARRGFTFTVLDAQDDVIGCVYIYPSRDAGHDVRVHSWVRASYAPLDPVLHDAVARWLADAWPFERVDYAPRTEGLLDAPPRNE
jgi:hypothetical protein